ncbi:hypothetical protein MIDIC_40002 [Alphaproteobacteria bacterium]
MARACRERGTRLVMLFVHDRDNVVPSLAALTYYQRVIGAETVVLPHEYFADIDLWRDSTHVNVEGSRLITAFFLRLELEKRLSF